MPTSPAAETPEVDWLTDEQQRAWRTFLTGSRRLLERLDQDLKEHGLSHDDYGVLVNLSEAENDRLRMADLANLSVESRSRLSHHIGRLEAKGLVERQSCPEDRRGFFAVLTPEGRAHIEAVAPHHVAGVREWFIDRLTPEELAVLTTALGRVADALGPKGPCPDTDAPAA